MSELGKIKSVIQDLVIVTCVNDKKQAKLLKILSYTHQTVQALNELQRFYLTLTSRKKEFEKFLIINGQLELCAIGS